MNTVLADVQPLNVNVKESGSRSDLSSSESKSDKFSSVLSREMKQERDASTQPENSQVTENKPLNTNAGRVEKVVGGSISDLEMPVAWLQDFTDQTLHITTEELVQPAEVVIDEVLLSSVTNASESEIPVVNIAPALSGETLPASGKSLPPGDAQANAQSVISISTLGVDGQSTQSDSSRQPKPLQPVVDADDAFAVKPNGLGEAPQIKANDFQMMQSTVPEVAELNASQARLQNPSAVISAGNNPLNSLLLPTELETLTVNNTRDTTAWGNGVGERVHWMINQKLNTATIRLDPPSLGRLEVNIQVSDDVTKVTINTQHAQTRDIIDNASFKLREFLQENGYQNVSVDVSHQEQQQQASQQTGGDSGESLADNQSNQDGVGENEGNEIRYFSSDSVVDLFA